MVKNKKPHEQPADPAERAREAEQWLAEQLRKVGWKSPSTSAVWKVVARKGNQEAVFTFPAHSESQIKRFLFFQGWDMSAAVPYANIDEALKDSNDPVLLKTKGMAARGNA